MMVSSAREREGSNDNDSPLLMKMDKVYEQSIIFAQEPSKAYIPEPCK